MHLEFIVDQTQKYSTWLVQGMTGSTPSATPSITPALSMEGAQERNRDAFRLGGGEGGPFPPPR